MFFVPLCRSSFTQEKAIAPHSSTLAWKIPWMEEPGRLHSMGSRRVKHDWATSLSLSRTGEGNGNPLQCSCLENPRDGGAWWAAVYGSHRVGHDWSDLAAAAALHMVLFSLCLRMPLKRLIVLIWWWQILSLFVGLKKIRFAFVLERYFAGCGCLSWQLFIFLSVFRKCCSTFSGL